MKTLPVGAAVFLSGGIRPRIFSIVLAAGLAIAAGVAPAGTLPASFSVKLLENVGANTYPYALNNQLQFHSAYVSDGPVPLHWQTNFVDFNERAQVLNWSYRDCCEFVIRHFFLTSPGGQTVWLDGMVEANAINDSSVIAGSISVDGNQQATLYDGSSYRTLGTLGGASSSATDVNNQGDAIGWSQTADGETRPFLYSGGQMLDLSTQPGWSATPILIVAPESINDLGEIVVSYFEGTGWHMMFYSGGTWEEIGAGTGQQFIALNDAGQILFTRYTDGGLRTMLWQDGEEAVLLDLIDPAAPYHISTPVDLNDNGQILVRGCMYPGPEGCAVLMLQPVPEPAAWSLLLAGMGLLTAWGRRRNATGSAKG